MQAPTHTEAIFDRQLSPLNNSTLIVALCMVIMNLCSKYLPLELNSDIDYLLQSAIMRKLVVFAILYLATRKFIYALFGTLVFYILTKFILNRNSKLSLINNSMKNDKKTDKINKEDINLIIEILEKTRVDEGVVRSFYNNTVDKLINKLSSS